jgi:hypothetical protein
MSAGGTAIAMAAECGGAAAGDREQDLPVLPRDPLAAALHKGRTGAANNIGRDLLPSGLPPMTQTAFPACRAQYPGGLKRCERWFLPTPHGLPRFIGGSASTTILSRPAQASLALRPARLLTHHAWALLRGSITTGCPLAMLASYQT